MESEVKSLRLGNTVVAYRMLIECVIVGYLLVLCLCALCFATGLLQRILPDVVYCEILDKKVRSGSQGGRHVSSEAINERLFTRWFL